MEVKKIWRRGARFVRCLVGWLGRDTVLYAYIRWIFTVQHMFRGLYLKRTHTTHMTGPPRREHAPVSTNVLPSRQSGRPSGMGRHPGLSAPKHVVVVVVVVIVEGLGSWWM